MHCSAAHFSLLSRCWLAASSHLLLVVPRTPRLQQTESSARSCRGAATSFRMAIAVGCPSFADPSHSNLLSSRNTPMACYGPVTSHFCRFPCPVSHAVKLTWTSAGLTDCYSAEEAALLDSMATGDFAMSMRGSHCGRVGFGPVRLHRSVDQASCCPCMSPRVRQRSEGCTSKI